MQMTFADSTSLTYDLRLSQKSQLLADDNVVAYLGSMEATESGLAPEGASNEDDDFS